MKFVCSKTILADIVNIVQKAIGSKTSHPILECIKIDASNDGHVVFTANSIELCIEYTSEITVYEAGTIALPSKIFGEIVRRLPEGEVKITCDETNYIADIECEHSQFNIQGMSVSDSPDVPRVDEEYRTRIS